MPYNFGGDNYNQQQFLAQALMQSAQNNASPLASGLGSFAGALLASKAMKTKEDSNKQLADLLMNAKTQQERANIALQSQEPSVQKLGMAALLSNAQKPYSNVGKIQADLAAGRIDPQTAQAALTKATTVSPMFGGMLTPYQQNQLDWRKQESDFKKDNQKYERKIRKQEILDKDIRDFTKWADTSGFSELSGSIKRGNELLAPYVKEGKLSGDIPGYGGTQWAPDFAISEEGRTIRQQISTIKNAIIKARSGSAVSEQEASRLLDEIGEGQGKKIKDDAQLLRGMSNVSAILNDRFQNIQAGYSPEVFQLYGDRGGNVGKLNPILPSNNQQPTALNGTIDSTTNIRPGSLLLPKREPGQSLSEAAAGGGLPPALQNDPRVQKARQEGYSDEEIMQFIGGRQ